MELMTTTEAKVMNWIMLTVIAILMAMWSLVLVGNGDGEGDGDDSDADGCQDLMIP